MKEFIDNEAKRFLSVVGSQLDNDTKSFLQNGELAFEDAHFYMKADVTGMAGLNPIIQASDSEEVGIRNVDRAELPALQNLILQKVIVKYATHATETDGAKLDFSSKKPATAVPALQNGELVIEQDDKPLFSIPISRLFNAADVDDIEKEGYELANWRLIKAGRKFSVNLRCANAESIPTSEKHHIEVTLVGTKTRKR